MNSKMSFCCRLKSRLFPYSSPRILITVHEVRTEKEIVVRCENVSCEMPWSNGR